MSKQNWSGIEKDFSTNHFLNVILMFVEGFAFTEVRRGATERIAEILSIDIKNVFFFFSIENFGVKEIPIIWCFGWNFGFFLFWKKNTDDRRKKIIVILIVITTNLGDMNTEASIESNYRFQDLAGLKQSYKLRTKDWGLASNFNATN